ncbi:MAG: hypothetical protein AAFX90_20650 [Pseudomonadota bacterium]
MPTEPLADADGWNPADNRFAQQMFFAIGDVLHEAAIQIETVSGRFVRVWVAGSRCGESKGSVPFKSTPKNDRFGDMRCIATECALQLRAYAASAMAASAQVRFVRSMRFCHREEYGLQ